MKKTIILLSIILLPLCVDAKDVDQWFAEGNEMYHLGNYDTAAACYQKVLASNYTSAELYYNLGNAYYRTGQMGMAILNYERALRLKPTMKDAQENLALAEVHTVDRIATLPQLFVVRWFDTLCTMVQTNKPASEAGHKLAMQVAAMKPVALDAQSVDQKILDEEYKTAVEKTKLEQVEKFVEMKVKKAGINPNLVDSEDHIESNMAKGWLTKEQADEARKIIAEAKVEGEAQLKMPMIENIAKGRVQKFLKESCLVDQEFQFGDGDKATVSQWLAQQDKELKIVAFKRFTLVAE